MAQIKVNFTIQGEQSETTFQLIKVDDNLWIKGISDISGEKEFPLYKSSETNILCLKDNNVFVEPVEIIEERLIGLSEEYIAALQEGLELDDDVEKRSEKPGYGPDEIYVENKPFSISTIMELINDGDLEVAPNFQRHFVWDKTRQSKLIESILLGLPLPSIYLSQYPDGRLTIVDGLQRITSIQRFMDDELVLCNMEYFKDCNGKKYSELKGVLPVLQYRRFRQTQIMCFVIDYRSPNALKFDLFRRLNTGGKTLNDQEIRNCLSRPHLQKLLMDMVATDEFKRATNNSLKDTRMAAQESALRFIYFYDQYTEDNPIGDYNGEIGDSLDRYVEVLNKRQENELRIYIDIFKKSMQMAYELFGENTFRKIDINSKKKFSINKPIMLAFTVLLGHHYGKYKEKVFSGVKLTKELGDLLLSDSKLSKMITTSTTHKASIKYTIETLKKNLLDKYLEI
ncbi:MAG: DUF262 domain-containing protein [Paludibacteraceae bacterium]|nr:DUF262 domain-containing protein [Paludibacteraceae bacterium]